MLALFSVYGDLSMHGAVRGLELFAFSVFPALFPFSICIGCLKRLGFFDSDGANGFWGLIRLFVLGSVAGNPTGSMLMASSESAHDSQNSIASSVYSALFNLASPVFITGSLGSRIFKFNDAAPTLLLLICHYLSSFLLLIGYFYISKIIFARSRNAELFTYSHASPVRAKPSKQAQKLASVFPSALMESSITMLKLCGTIVFFVALTEIAKDSALLLPFHSAIRALLTGMFEMTNGLSLLAAASVDMRLELSFASFILAFGGICIFMQANAILAVDAAVYLSTKIIHGFISAVMCYLLFPFFMGGNLAASCTSGAEHLAYRSLTLLQIALLFLIASVAASLTAIFAAKRTRV